MSGTPVVTASQLRGMVGDAVFTDAPSRRLARDPRAGGRAHKALMGKIVAALRLRGFAVYFVWDSRHSPAGKWDITALKPPRWLEIEVKSGQATLSPEQRAYGELIAQYDHIEASVVRDSDEAWRAFVDWISA